MGAKDAAKRHREQAEHLSTIAEMRAKDGNHVHACAWRDAAEYHALAARVLDALAVPGMARLLRAGLYRDPNYEPSNEQCAAIDTLANAAKGTP